MRARAKVNGMDEDDRYYRDDTSLWLLGLIDGITGAAVLAAIGVVYAFATGIWQ
jgi:hypothetical protein